MRPARLIPKREASSDDFQSGESWFAWQLGGNLRESLYGLRRGFGSLFESSLCHFRPESANCQNTSPSAKTTIARCNSRRNYKLRFTRKSNCFGRKSKIFRFSITNIVVRWRLESRLSGLLD